jgi:MFS family permease
MSEASGPKTIVEKKQIANADSSSSVPSEKVGPFASLRIPNFRLLLTGQILNQAGGWIQQMTVNWLVYSLTGSGAMLGYISLIRAGTSLGMIPVSGLLIDRVNHRKIMLISDLWSFMMVLGIGLILVFGYGNISYLLIFVFLGGLTYTIDQTLRQVVIFDLVPRAITPNALALLVTGAALMRSFGPAIGGYLIVWFGPGGNFLVQAGLYVLIAINIILLRFPVQKSYLVQGSPVQNIREGIAYIFKARDTRVFILMGFILPLFTIPIVTILPPIYAVKVFHGGANILGILLASIGVGGAIGGFLTVSLYRVERRGLVQLFSLFLLSLSLIAFAFSTELWAGLPFLALAGFFEAIFLTTNQTLLQLSIPDNLRGRVTSVIYLTAGLSPLGGLLAGFGSDLLGGPKIITIILAGIAASIAVIVFFASPTIRNYRLSQGIAANAKVKEETIV